MAPPRKTLPKGTCICLRSDCKIERGTCHCGCGGKTSIAKYSSKREGCIVGEPRRYLSNHFSSFPKEEIIGKAACICGDPQCDIEFGSCHCGCGARTNIAEYSDRAHRNLKGWPLRFLRGHSGIEKRAAAKGPFLYEGEICFKIPLTQGQFATVDAATFDSVGGLLWFAKWNPDTNSFYAARKVRLDGKMVLYPLHRHILGLPPTGRSEMGDHKNGVTLDCRRSNLRVCNAEENCRNRRVHSNNRLGRKGVFPKGNRFGARIWLNGKVVDLGTFETEERAGEAYVTAAKKYFGEFWRG